MDKSNIIPDDFINALNDIHSITGDASQMLGFVRSIINAHTAEQQYQQIKNQLAMVKIQREIIMRNFDSLENFIRLAYEERAVLLKKAEVLIERGLENKNSKEISFGLQIIKVVLLTNPFDKKEINSINYQKTYQLLNSYLD